MKIKNPDVSYSVQVYKPCTSLGQHSTGPSSLNVHSLFTFSIVNALYWIFMNIEIHYKMSGLLSELEA
jgi:hypothetical protein